MEKALIRKITRLTNSDRYNIIDLYVKPQWIAITVATEDDAVQLSYDLENIEQVYYYGARVSWKDFSDVSSEIDTCGEDWKVVIVKDADYKGRIRFDY